MSQISFVSVLALDELVSVGADRGEQVSLIDTLADKHLDPTSGVESQETRGLLAAAINSLSEREKIVVTLYYFEGLTLAEIGEILGVTESRVCQIHTKAVGGLRGQLSGKVAWITGLHLPCASSGQTFCSSSWAMIAFCAGVRGRSVEPVCVSRLALIARMSRLAIL